MDESGLKEKLVLLAEDGFRPNNELPILIPAMLTHIGSTDPYLRDQLIYTAFATWILDHNALTPTQLRNLLQAILSNQHILYQIGEQASDAIFRRSFSILLLPLVLIAHRTHPFLTQPEIMQVKEKLIAYLATEKDRRGYVAEKGWAHGIAHAADAIDDLVQCPELVADDLMEMLVAIRTVMSIQEANFTHEEDERMVTAVLELLKRNLVSDAEFVRWIAGFADSVAGERSLSQTMTVRTNITNFLQALYFRLRWQQKTGDRFSATIEQTLRKISRYVDDK